MTIADQEKPGESRQPLQEDDAAPAAYEAWENADMDDAKGSVDEDIPDSEEVEIVDEEVDLSQDDDDDNPYQESDEALPDDAEEAAIRRDLLNREETERFGH